MVESTSRNTARLSRTWKREKAYPAKQLLMTHGMV